MEKKKAIQFIKSIFAQGYVASRGTEEYRTQIGPWATCAFVNCFEHAALNLTNAQLDYLKLQGICCDIFDIAGYTSGEVKDCLFAFVKDVGLSIKETKDKNIELAKNQWLIALYSVNMEGYHFLRREKDNTWTAKEGFGPEVVTYKYLPQNYYSENKEDYYELTNLFIITNPNKK